MTGPALVAPRPADRGTAVSGRGPRSVAELLYAEPFAFDFFQAVRLLERLVRDRVPVTRAPSPTQEVVRFRVRQSFAFPPSAIYELQPPTEQQPLPTLVVAFLGLTGPSGVLPRSYTELLLRQERDSRHPEKAALRDWLDLFNHRLISLFYRAWEKYRFYIPFERREFALPEPDAFTQALFSLIGLGTPSLRNRLRVAVRSAPPQHATHEELGGETPLAKIDDLSLLRYGGFLSHRPRCAVSLEVFLRGYFRVPVKVLQFQGQWLRLEPDSQSSLGARGVNNALGQGAVVGDRIWDVQSKVRIRLGPLTYEQFLLFLPDPVPLPQRKAIFLLAHLVRLYLGPEMDVEVQLVLQAREVPNCQVGRAAGPVGPRIGWNCWSKSRPSTRDADDPVFEARERVFLV